MNTRLFVIVFFMTIGVLLAVWSIANLQHLKHFPNIISSYYAKEFCSCYYVTKLQTDACHAQVAQWIPIQSFTVDENNKKVIVTGLWHTNSAKYINDRLGCQFTDE